MKNGKRILSVTVKHLPDDISEGNLIGIIADAEIAIPQRIDHADSIIQHITSGGLWGVEPIPFPSSATDEELAYFVGLEREQLAELKYQLRAIGFSTRAIGMAFKAMKHERCW